jgi:hypothetical protein
MAGLRTHPQGEPQSLYAPNTVVLRKTSLAQRHRGTEAQRIASVRQPMNVILKKLRTEVDE